MSDNFTTVTKRLDEILTLEQQLEVSLIVTRIEQGRGRTDDLRRYLRSQRESLRAREVDADYLFYALVYARSLPL